MTKRKKYKRTNNDLQNIHIKLKMSNKNSLKIPKEQSEAINRRRTDNTMTKRKKYKRTNNDLQNIHIKQKMSNKNSLKIPKEQSEAINRRTDNTMTKRKSIKGQTTIYKTYI
jgi:hypothetical protein